MRDEAARILPALEAAKLPMDRLAFAKLMNRNRAVYGVGDMAPAEWTSAMESYFAVLQDFSEVTLQNAFMRWNRGEDQKDPAMGQFFPKPAQLVHLASKSKAEVFVAAYRAKKSLEGAEQRGDAWTPERKREERQKMIDQGLLTPDGKPNFTIGAKTIPSAPRRDQHALAEQLRRTDAQARQGGAPISRRHIEAEDSGEVL